MRLIALLLLVLMPLSGSSCGSDQTSPVCQWDDITIAFTGIVVEAGPEIGHHPLDRTPDWYRVRVTERFRGVDDTVSEFAIHAYGGSSNTKKYTIGEEYLFVASQTKALTLGLPQPIPVISGGFCSLHRPVSRAAEDISFLRLKSPGQRIYGSVHAGGEPRTSLFTRMAPPLQNAIVKVAGPSGELVARQTRRVSSNSSAFSPANTLQRRR